MDRSFNRPNPPDPTTPPPEHEPEVSSSQAKQVKFFEAAEPLFLRYGFKKTTVEEICAEAGASKRTFYELFKDKTDCFLQLALYVTRLMVEAYQAQLVPDMPAVQRLELYLEQYLHAISTRPVFRLLLDDPALMKELATSSKTGIQFFEAVQSFTKIVEYGIETGEFRPMLPDAVTWIVHSLLDGLYLLGSDMYPNPEEFISAEFQEQVFAFIRHGLGAHDE